ncbi:hypothetical protein A2926_01275 [Candidatus Giovannonibacteria bacterium RIFCSPLOWO2_01_FULL_44_40]|uniref:HAD family hydrolase n=1 Tax=Candidatus Giovannonibacteria bacterium RIFCSPHIGHO2_01_FULL_45_23 TaxID=1798325 RepID=A0A1F5VIL9_9BACT|nr:MAG: hypothetical protein A2834_02345 [Candidatus Giovannonibacteria bacterium RIFCSPHIGHO2_01_FULL_45_23]OGF75283.1 MAG: hypothetical protein A3C77_02400 [Candidatus Giovannonibacteria bacterium RIFCSPHIGHO2_02_FULL_45_13]OGF80043.1 MAG: hypothetical protein A2926_01275 [Candidatus Giovannonibacteria bacterium RIFCSPLOWO2_01_FULL_44_40]
MPKTVLCVDWGNVLFKFDGKPIAKLLKKGRKEILLRDFVNPHDKNLISAFEFYEGLKSGNHFRKEVRWTEFANAYLECWIDVNWRMFSALENLKKANRARLVTISDSNHFCFNLASLLFPKAVDLFIENGREQFILSYLERSLKREKNPFIRAPSKFGFFKHEAAFVDDKEYNLEAWISAGFDKDACFLYKLGSARNHAQFEKFLDKHFPPK